MVGMEATVSQIVKSSVSAFIKQSKAPPAIAGRAIEVCKALLNPSSNPYSRTNLHPDGRFVALKSGLQKCRPGVFSLFEPSGYGKTSMMEMMASKMNGLKVFSLRGVDDPIFTSFLKQMGMPTSNEGLSHDVFVVSS